LASPLSGALPSNDLKSALFCVADNSGLPMHERICASEAILDSSDSRSDQAASALPSSAMRKTASA
jgi:hypothetical protein